MSLEYGSLESECLKRLQEHEVQATAYDYEYDIMKTNLFACKGEFVECSRDYYKNEILYSMRRNSRCKKRNGYWQLF